MRIWPLLTLERADTNAISELPSKDASPFNGLDLPVPSVLLR